MSVDLAKVMPLLLAGLSDGKLDATEFAAIIGALMAGQKPAGTPPVVSPHVGTTPQPTQPVSQPPQPTAPNPLAQVAALTVNLDLFLAEGVPCPYRVEEFPDYYQIIKTDGTEALPIHGGAYLHAGYLDAQGEPIKFEPGSPLDHTAIWIAKRVSDGLTVWCGPGNPAKEGGDRAVANFRLAEYERTRGMDVPVHFPTAADESTEEIMLKVGGLISKPVRFPRID